MFFNWYGDVYEFEQFMECKRLLEREINGHDPMGTLGAFNCMTSSVTRLHSAICELERRYRAAMDLIHEMRTEGAGK